MKKASLSGGQTKRIGVIKRRNFIFPMNLETQREKEKEIKRDPAAVTR